MILESKLSQCEGVMIRVLKGYGMSTVKIPRELENCDMNVLYLSYS